ncbi:CD151 antigen-like [Homalodisca vitripennis]|uniref:Tetraspanin n=1 Tax=Homalodisca liturata TaxID=320908 RepID=A0A1B6JGB7_9HEMI|nr:CD151 antigen-like [Homalodisca vitripennis]XP_046674299.1 CD151 antigen-like [Homalodisca vitripennis]
MGFGSEMNGCGQFVKYGMFVSNFVIFVGGITVFVIGIWTLIDKSFINELLGTNLFMGAVYILIATGALVTLVSFFGCLGAIKEIKCMLLTYFIMVLIILVVMLVGGILGYVFREKVRYSMEQEMYSSIKSYNEKKSLRRAWDDTQENLHCCGVTSFTDWRGVIPDSCCRDLAGKKLPCKSFQSDGNIYTDGCLRAAEVFVKDHASVIGGAAITVSCLMIFGLIFAFILFKVI